MARREYTGNWPCREPGCRERGFYIYDTQRDYQEAARRYAKTPWVCTRHSRPEQVLGQDNPARTVEVVASRIRFSDYDRRMAEYRAAVARGSMFAHEPAEFIPGLYWTGAGFSNGFAHGPGFMAFANDFPEGTRLRVTVEVLPPAGEGSAAA
jgi:hypothetical protein